MLDKEMLLQKMEAYLDQKKEMPIVKIFNEHHVLVKRIAQHRLFKDIESGKILDNQVRNQEFYNRALSENQEGHFIFFGNFGLAYCFKPLYFEEVFIGAAVFGGFFLSSIDYHATGAKKFFEQLTKEELSQLICRKEELKEIFHQFAVDIDRFLETQDEVFFKITATLKDNWQEVFSLEKLSKLHFISNSHIRRLFKKHTGKGFKEYYRELKLERAKLLLIDEKLTPQEVLEKLGYIKSECLLNAIKQLY